LTAALVYLAARSAILHRSGLEAGQQSWQQVLYTTPSVFVFYIGKLLWPVRLSGFYPTPLLSSPTARTWLAASLILGGCAVLAWLEVKRSDATGDGLAMCVAAGLLVLPLLPALVGMRLFRPGDLVHDRYLYLPSVGFCLLAGMLAKRLWRGAKTTKTVAGAMGLCVFACFAWLNLTQQGFYKNDELFYRRGIEVGPNNVLAIDYLGNWYFAEKQMGRALEQFALAHKLKPEDSSATFFLATGLFVDKQYAAAEPYLEELAHAPRLWPGQRPIVLLCLGKTEIRLGHLSHAEEVLGKLKREDDSKPGLHETLGDLYQTQGKIPEAQAEYVREFQVSSDPEARQKALDLARLLRSRPASSPPIPRLPPN
jgi:Tfp pilus assembly protein PilF